MAADDIQSPERATRDELWAEIARLREACSDLMRENRRLEKLHAPTIKEREKWEKAVSDAHAEAFRASWELTEVKDDLRARIKDAVDAALDASEDGPCPLCDGEGY